MLLLLLLGAVLIQAANVQFRRSAALASSPGNPRVIQAPIGQSRGEILAADGSVLAQSVPTPKGVYKYQRVYPTKALMGQITGVDSPTYGLYGIEASYNSYLLSHKQPAQSLAQLLSPKTSTDSVTLTVVPQLQTDAMSALAGKDGAVVAIDPRNGAVEAMYSNPSYDPNPLAAPSSAVEKFAFTAFNTPDAAGFAPFNPLAYRRAFPPGSTFKVVTTTATYAKAPLLVFHSYPTLPTTPLPDTNQTLSNYGFNSCGGTVAEMLPPSCDTGFALLGLDIGAQKMWEQATEFGFNSTPPLDIPGVLPSSFPTPAQLAHNLPGLAYSAIGQEDVSATALQNALDAAAIANEGSLMGPHLMQDIRTQQGDLVKAYSPKVWQETTTPVVAAQVSKLMQEVVTQGTASGIFNPLFQVAAKTGTAQTSLTNVNTSTDDWMIAFAPADNPVIAIAVVVPNQNLSATGASVAGPIMNCMIQQSLAHAGNLAALANPASCNL
jgi:peptidoglycan glycosyltransferase